MPRLELRELFTGKFFTSVVDIMTRPANLRNENKGDFIMWVVIVIGVISIFAIVFIYNSLIAKKNQVKNVFGTIDALLKKRYDLLPNLVAAVKAYMQHEKNLLTEITEMRAKAVSGQLSDDEHVELDNKLSMMLGGIMVAVENYPDLKANQNFLQLQRTMNELEEQISAARRAYNAAVTDYNNAVEMFPTNLVASMMRYRQKKVFEIGGEQRENIEAEKLFKS
jgi:LemA protein